MGMHPFQEDRIPLTSSKSTKHDQRKWPSLSSQLTPCIEYTKASLSFPHRQGEGKTEDGFCPGHSVKLHRGSGNKDAEMQSEFPMSAMARWFPKIRTPSKRRSRSYPGPKSADDFIMLVVTCSCAVSWVALVRVRAVVVMLIVTTTTTTTTSIVIIIIIIIIIRIIIIIIIIIISSSIIIINNNIITITITIIIIIIIISSIIIIIIIIIINNNNIIITITITITIIIIISIIIIVVVVVVVVLLLIIIVIIIIILLLVVAAAVMMVILSCK